jgi:thioredoxin reductase (NADPH)
VNESAGPPVILAVDPDPEAFSRLRQELVNRYGHDYRVVCERTTDGAVAMLAALAVGDARLAITLVASGPGADHALARSRALHPTTRRALLVAANDADGLSAAPGAMGHGLVELVVVKPFRTPDETFHRAITDALYEWGRSEPASSGVVQVVGERWSARSQEIRDRLDRNGVAYAFHTADSPSGAAVLADHGLTAARLPVFILFDGQILVQPDDAAVADRLSRSTFLAGHVYDVAIIGGGPAGLAAAVYASSEGLSVLVLERDAIGGQAGSTSLIRNYLGFPHGIAGNELAARALQQAWLFGTTFHWMRGVVGLETDRHEHLVHLSDNTIVRSRAVIIATGVSWRRLDVPRLDELIGAGVCYGAATSEAAATEGQHVHVVGGGNSAGQAALHLARYAARVSVLVRGSTLADTMSEYLSDQLAVATNIDVRFNTTVAGVHGDQFLEQVVLDDSDSNTRTTEATGGLFVLIGGEPRTDWLPDDIARDSKGYVLTGHDLADRSGRGPLPLESSRPGVFAAGDVRHGSVKRVASAVGEGAIAIHACHQFLDLQLTPR